MARCILVILAIFCLMPTQALADTESERQIRAVVEEFGQAIEAKDRHRFLALFHGVDIPWIQVMDETSLVRERQKNPGQARASPLGANSPTRFMDVVTASPHRLREDFGEVHIDSDGMIANVSFPYVFYRNDYRMNWGHEAWQLVLTDTGWKITSVVYSVVMNPEPGPATEGEK